MRIWQQSLVDLTEAAAYQEALVAHARLVARPDTEVAVHGIGAQFYGGATAAEVAANAYLTELAKIRILDNVRRAERAGYDAFVIATLQDPALREARSMSALPIVGYGEAALHLAAMLGDVVGIVAFNRPLFPLIRQRLNEYGMSRRAVPIQDVDVSYQSLMSALTGDSQHVVDRFQAAAEHAIRDGAEVIIPGQTLLGLVIAKAGVRRIADVPVVDPLATCIKFAELLVELERVAGISVSRRGYFYALPSAETVDALRRSVGRSLVGDTSPGSVDD